MKRIIYTLALAAVLTSCSGFLKEQPTTRLLDGSAFDTEAALEAQVYGLYGSLPSTFASSNWFYYFNCASPLVHWKSTRNGLLYEQGLRGTLYANQSTGRGLLTSIFGTIYKANAVINGLKDSPVDEAYKKEIEAEARFFRAFMYFYAVRLFGDVPLFTKPVASDKDAYIKRTSYIVVYGQIIEDFQFAFANMRTQARQMEITGLAGRVQKYAAEACLAQVYLQIASMLSSPDDQAFGTIESGEVKPDFTSIGISSADQAWGLALASADDVIANGGYALEDDYRTLFDWDPESESNAFFSKEKIFAMQTTPNGRSNSIASLYTLPAYMVGTLNAETLTHGSTAGMVRPGRFVFQKWARTYGGPSRSDGDNFFYTGCYDPRLDASYIYGHYYATADNNGNPYDSPTKVSFYPSTNGSEQAYYKKYFYPQFDQDAGYADYYLMRLPEMFFVAAEACAELGRDGALGDAYDYIECLHKRARASASEPSTQPQWTRGQFATKEELVVAIFWERVFEMGGEGHEWFDSHRRGAKWLLDNVYEPTHEFLMEKEQSSYRNTYWYARGFELPRTLENVRNCLLCDYPQYEILYNQALTSADQNYFNSSKAVFNVSAGGSTTNEDYDHEEDILPW